MGRLDACYAALPVWAQHGTVSAYGAYWHWLRFGPGYATFVHDYERRAAFTAAEWIAWQTDRLAHLLRGAAAHVPYYRRTWSASEKAAATAGSLQDLPLLEKNPIRAEPGAFLRDDLGSARIHTFHTSGSTGTPIASLWTTRDLRRSMALREVRSVRWAGASFAQPRATFSGRMIEPDPDSVGPFYRYNVVERQVYLSPFHLRPETASRYVEALAKHRIEWLTGYAFSYALLAQFVLDRRLDVPPLKAVVTTSEKVTPEMRRVMEAAYRCPVFEEYSTVENALFASECRSGRLHVSPDAGIVEILRPDGTPCDAGEIGEVVATGFIREAQPFIRFRLGDLACWDDAPCKCGSTMPVIKEVVGRVEDAVVGADGREMVRFHGVFVAQPHVVEAQVIQEALTRIRVKVVPSAGFGGDDADDIVRRVRQRLGRETDVTVEPVASIPRTAAGKFRAVISHVERRAGVRAGWSTGVAARPDGRI